MDNYASEPHREHTFLGEEFLQRLHEGRLCDQVDEFFLLLLFARRVFFCLVRVGIVVGVDLIDNRLVDRRFQECSVLYADKAATAMCV